jgi:hypothetical protein
MQKENHQVVIEYQFTIIVMILIGSTIILVRKRMYCSLYWYLLDFKKILQSTDYFLKIMQKNRFNPLIPENWYFQMVKNIISNTIPIKNL